MTDSIFFGERKREREHIFNEELKIRFPKSSSKLLS